MANPASILFQTNLKAWFSARGFLLVVVASFVPLVLTGAWVLTHQADLETGVPAWQDEFVEEGETVNFTVVMKNSGRFDVGAFNASLAVGSVRVAGQTTQFLTEKENKTAIDGLDAGESRTVDLSWTARGGVYMVLSRVDVDKAVGEKEELARNQEFRFIQVHLKRQGEADAPTAPGNLTGNGTVDVDAQVSRVVRSLEAPEPGNLTVFTVEVSNAGPNAVNNATVLLQVGQVFSHSFIASQEERQEISLAPGESRTLQLNWTALQGKYWNQVTLNVTGDARDRNATDNYHAEAFIVEPKVNTSIQPPELDDKLTIKSFYVDILSLLHLRILIPFIALFYAGGVIADEKDRGTLPYLLTRPIPRWLIPVTKFAASYIVAAAAVLLGVLGTFFILLETPEGNIGFLTTPLLFTLFTLFVYGAFFILLGVFVERPYLIGLAFVLGWETVAGNFVEWVENLTISHYLDKAIAGWPLDQGLVWLPDEKVATYNLWISLGLGVVFLVAAALVMRRREFDV